MKKSIWLPLLLFCAGAGVYVYSGIEYNAWMRNLTLMIAESRTEEKDVMVKVAVSLINQNN